MTQAGIQFSWNIANSWLTNNLNKLLWRQKMKIKNFLRDFAITFVIVFIVSMIVSYIYNLIAHSAGSVNWETSFQLAIIFGIVFPAIRIFEKRQKD